MQAYLDKHRRRQSHQFAPHELRELDPTEKTGSDSVSYVKLEGLGKIPFSNIRRPKPLMDVDPTPAHAKPEGQYPLLSALQLQPVLHTVMFMCSVLHTRLKQWCQSCFCIMTTRLHAWTRPLLHSLSKIVPSGGRQRPLHMAPLL